MTTNYINTYVMRTLMAACTTISLFWFDSPGVTKIRLSIKNRLNYHYAPSRDKNLRVTKSSTTLQNELSSQLRIIYQWWAFWGF